MHVQPDAEYSEGLGMILGLIAILIALGGAFHVALSLHGPETGPRRPAVVVSTPAPLDPVASIHR